MSIKKQQEPIRIAHVIGKLNAGGVESVINNYYRNIDRTKYQFDFFIDADSKFEPPQEIIDMGARYYTVPPYQKLPQHMKELVRLFRKNRYQIVHSSMNTLAVFSLCAAKVVGVPIRICHNHTMAARGETKKNILKYCLRPFAKIFPTHLCACSRYAAEWIYGKKTVQQGKVTIINNAIETEKFAYDQKVREEVRKELGVENRFVIGHVGRFCFQKNQEFLINLMPAIIEEDPNAVLLLIGTGNTKEKIEKIVQRLKIDGSVIFTGVRNDVNRLYQAMDVFVLPSRYEGLPVVGIEAQAAGLPCLMSDNMTQETKVSDHIQFISLDDKTKWINAILSANISNRCCQIIPEFDMKYEVRKLEQFYQSTLEGTGIS